MHCMMNSKIAFELREAMGGVLFENYLDNCGFEYPAVLRRPISCFMWSKNSSSDKDTVAEIRQEYVLIWKIE